MPPRKAVRVRFELMPTAYTFAKVRLQACCRGQHTHKTMGPLWRGLCIGSNLQNSDVLGLLSISQVASARARDALLHSSLAGMRWHAAIAILLCCLFPSCVRSRGHCRA